MQRLKNNIAVHTLVTRVFIFAKNVTSLSQLLGLQMELLRKHRSGVREAVLRKHRSGVREPVLVGT
jgi:hypothetical protein